MSSDTLRSRLLGITALASEYCIALETARDAGKQDFVVNMLRLLPRIYLEFSDLEADEEAGVPLDEPDSYLPAYVDEDFYESVRRNVEAVMGEDDVYLETFEEDMKYSDTPIAASVAESLADIFQPLYNFISVVKDSEGEDIVTAYLQCRSDFVAYWSQTLCNVLRPLNSVKLKSLTIN